jgi:hypothetical protein
MNQSRKQLQAELAEERARFEKKISQCEDNYNKREIDHKLRLAYAQQNLVRATARAEEREKAADVYCTQTEKDAFKAKMTLLRHWHFVEDAVEQEAKEAAALGGHVSAALRREFLYQPNRPTHSTTMQHLQDGLLPCRLCGSPVHVEQRHVVAQAEQVCEYHVHKMERILRCELPYLESESSIVLSGWWSAKYVDRALKDRIRYASSLEKRLALVMLRWMGPEGFPGNSTTL